MLPFKSTLLFVFPLDAHTRTHTQTCTHTVPYHQVAVVGQVDAVAVTIMFTIVDAGNDSENVTESVLLMTLVVAALLAAVVFL